MLLKFEVKLSLKLSLKLSPNIVNIENQLGNFLKDILILMIGLFTGTTTIHCAYNSFKS